MPRWVLGAAPLALVAIAVAVFALLDGPGLGERRGPPAEELAVEQTVLRPGVIELEFAGTGLYMFHAHQSEFAELGWTGFFNVVD